MAQERGRPQGATVGSVLSVDVALDDWGSGVAAAAVALILSRFSEKPRRSCLDRGGRWPGEDQEGPGPGLHYAHGLQVPPRVYAVA